MKQIEIMAENLDLFEDYDSSFEFEGFIAEELGEDNPRLEESLNSDIEVEEYQESEEEDDSDSDSDAENVDLTRRLRGGFNIILLTIM